MRRQYASTEKNENLSDTSVGIFRNSPKVGNKVRASSYSSSVPPPLCALLRHYVAMLIAAVLQGRQAGRQSSCREQGRLTTTGWLVLGKSHTQHSPILWSRAQSFPTFNIFWGPIAFLRFQYTRWNIYFVIPSTWNDCSPPRLANGYCGGSCLVDYPSSPSKLHGRARRRPRSAGWMCVKQRRTPSADEDGDNNDAWVSSAEGELIVDVRATSPPHKSFP